MNRHSPRTSALCDHPGFQRHAQDLARYGSGLALLVIVLGLLLAWSGCTDNPVKPQPSNTIPAVLAGIVHNNVGTPLPGIVVSVDSLIDGRAASISARLGPDKVFDAQTAITDDLGWFAFTELMPGSYIISAATENHLAGTNTGTLPTASAVAETTVVDILLVPTGTFSGVVLLPHEPDMSGTTVLIEGAPFFAQTDINGAYIIPNVPAGDYRLNASHPGDWFDESATASMTMAGATVVVDPMTLPRRNNLTPILAIDLPLFGGSTHRHSTRFLATVSDPDGKLVTCDWDFEDDGIYDASATVSVLWYGISAQVEVFHTFNEIGVFRTRLRATDIYGASDTTSIEVIVYGDIYVSQTTGADTNPGTRDSPVATISRGRQLVYEGDFLSMQVAAGTYVEPISLSSAATMIGGLDPSTWTRTSGDRSVWQNIYPTTEATYASNFRVVGFEFRAADATEPGEPSIAVALRYSSGVIFEDCGFTSGRGGDGKSGFGIYYGDKKGNSGQHGQSPDWDMGNFYGGLGGEGGFPISGMHGATGGGGNCAGDGYSGWVGQGSTDNGGLGGISSTVCGEPAGDGQNGLPGQDGLDARNTPAVSFWHGPVANGRWSAVWGLDGDAGATGSGGGGGGGGGSGLNADCSTACGGGGGGGGATEWPGEGGTGGQGGGASIAFLLDYSSATFRNCQFTTGEGGKGGTGGSGDGGASGGFGGLGAPGLGVGGHGGIGGRGGSSGRCGGGGGGPGGPSLGIYAAKSSPTLGDGLIFTLGSGGQGGAGGIHGDRIQLSAPGQEGPEQDIFYFQ